MSTVEQPLNKIAATLVDLQERYAKALEVVEAARWALDLIDMYDRYLVALGEPAEKVLSATHVAGKVKARVALAAYDAASSSLAEGEQDA